MSLWVTLFFMLGALAPTAWALAGSAPEPRAQQTQARIQLSTGVARVGEQVVLNIIVENAPRAAVRALPEIAGLRLGGLEGPSRNQSMYSFNGRVRRQSELRWSVLIHCEQEGEFEIPPLEVEVAGKLFRTQPEILKVVQDMKGADLGFFSLRGSSSKVVEGQPFTLELVFGWEEGLNANYANLSLPWWRNLSGTLELDQAKNPDATEAVTINDRYQVDIERLEDPKYGGKRVYRIRRSYLATRSGRLDFPTSFLEFGYKKRGGFFNQSTRVKNYFVRADPLDLEVIPLPKEGRPFEYSGAVGSIRARSSADVRSVLAGDSVKLTVDWTGVGNMEFFEVPDLALLDSFRGFQLYGSTEEKGFDRRRVVYDIVPTSEEVTEIPAVPLWVFDPEQMEYVEVLTEPIEIRVRPLQNAITLESSEGEAFERDIRDIHPAALSAHGRAVDGVHADRVLLAASAALLPLWLLVRTAVRRRRGDPDAPLQRRRRRAGRALQQALRRDPAPKATLEAFTTYLAARSGEGDQAWSGRALVPFAEASGWGDHRSTWSAAADLMGRLEKAAYGAGASVDSALVLDMAQRLGRAGL